MTRGGASRRADIVIGAIILLIVMAMYLHTFSEKYDTGPLFGDVSTVFVPRLILIALGLLSVGLMLRGAVRPENGVGRTLNWGRIVATFGVACAMSFGAYWVGYWIAMPLGVFLAGVAIGYPRYLVLAAAAALATITVWATLGYLARVPLPHGQLF